MYSRVWLRRALVFILIPVASFVRCLAHRMGEAILLGVTMKQIPLTQGKFALVDDDDFERVSQFKWNACHKRHTWYAHRSKKAKPYRYTYSMHRFIMDEPEGLEVDHIDGNGLNNQKSNLRIATRSQNACNRGKAAHNKSGFKGIFWSNKDKCWVAHITVHRQGIYLGGFKDKIKAAQAYDRAAIEYFGGFAQINGV